MVDLNEIEIEELKNKVKSLRNILGFKSTPSFESVEINLDRENKRNLIPKLPTKLPGSFWGITAFFNPAGYKNKVQNYKEFRISSKKQGLSLLCVELAYDNKPFELLEEDADILIQIRADSKKSVMWQKERLLNIGLENLPKDCDKIAWLDCDIIFDNDNWIKETGKLLEEYVIVQPFSFVVRMPKGGIFGNPFSFDFGVEENQKFYGISNGVILFGNSVLDDFNKHGHTGFAWAARKEIFNSTNFYDKLILGSGDLFIAQSFYGDIKNHISTLSSKKMNLYQEEWLKRICDNVKKSIYFNPGFIFHLWHGNKKNRLHDERFSILRKHDFNPSKDIKIGQNRVLEWASNKPEFHKEVRNYFYIRKEDE